MFNEMEANWLTSSDTNNLEYDDISREKLQTLDTLINTVAQQNAVKHIHSIGLAHGLSKDEYYNKLDIKLYRQKQKKWFQKNYSQQISQILFDDAKHVQQIPSKVNRRFMIATLKQINKAIEQEWTLHGAKNTQIPENALSF